MTTTESHVPPAPPSDIATNHAGREPDGLLASLSPTIAGTEAAAEPVPRMVVLRDGDAKGNGDGKYTPLIRARELAGTTMMVGLFCAAVVAEQWYTVFSVLAFGLAVAALAWVYYSRQDRRSAATEDGAHQETHGSGQRPG